MSQYLLPDVGEGLTEAEIVSWKVAVGDVIEINDIVVEIETAKSLVELPSPYAGTVTALLVAEGETVAVGTPIITVTEVSNAAALEIDLSNPAASGSMEGASLVGRIKAERGPVRRARRVASGAVAAQMQTQAAFEPLAAPMVEAGATDPEPAPTPAAIRALAKPPVRRLAKDLGVDLTTCRATGPGGTVTRADVQASAPSVVEERALRDASSLGSSGTEPTSVSKPPAEPLKPRETREPIKGVRKMMGEAMVASAFTAPHVTEWVTIDVTRTMALVDRLRAHRDFGEVKVSPLLILARAVTLAMRRTPEINSWWDDPAQEVVVKHDVNLGIAAATPRGLVVPHIKRAQDLTLVELAGALEQLTATARDGRTQPAETTGGTFTITNVGVFGIDAGTPIINPGESAILCFGAVRKQPWVVTTDGPISTDEIVVRQVTTLALSFDHRHIDGALGSRFLADVAGILEDPATAMLF